MENFLVKQDPFILKTRLGLRDISTYTIQGPWIVQVGSLVYASGANNSQQTGGGGAMKYNNNTKEGQANMETFNFVESSNQWIWAC